jgi:hypothetical protein
MPLEYLFSAELHYQQGLEPLVSPEDRDDQLIGSGDGAVNGDRLAGSLRWTLFEEPGELVCAMTPVAVIDTVDGAQVRLEGRGYARRARAQDRVWQVAATLRFASDDQRYRWLNGALGVWEGEFDADAHRARYRASLQTPNEGLDG